jgi:hypothetical protein
MPTTFLIQDIYPYEIPDFKGDEKEIINFDIPKKSDQYWQKQEVPKRFESKIQEIKWIEREFRRLNEGVFFLNNGELTYLNKKHYRFLQYYTGAFEGKDSPDYWEEHRKYFYFLEYVQNHPLLRGDFTIKPRRAGVTQIHNSDVIEIVTSDFYKFGGLMSANLEKVKSVQFRPIRNAVMKYPKQFRPLFKKPNGGIPQAELDFSPEKVDDEREYLRGWVRYTGTTATGFDGEKLHTLKVDEVLKFLGINPMTIIAPQMETMKLPSTGEIIGKASLFSTMGLDDKGMKLAIEEGRKLWGDSNMAELTDNGSTRSGFARYFMSCLDTHLIDKYGFSDRGRVEEKYNNDLKAIIEKHGEGSKDHIELLRTAPRTINDVFDSPKLGSAFNSDGRVSRRKIYVANLPQSEKGYVCGKFFEDVNGKVYFDTSIEYKDWWKISLTNIAKPNNVRYWNKEYELPRNPETVIGFDPVKLEETRSDHISKPCGLIYKKFDHYSRSGVENKIIGIITLRTNDLDEVAEQIALAARYYGAYISPEANVGERYFKKHGYNKMVVVSPYDRKRGIYISTTGVGKRPLADGMALISDYIKKPKNEIEEDLLNTILFDELLSELESFDADKLNTHDTIAALIQCFITASKIMKATATHDGKRRPLSEIFWG